MSSRHLVDPELLPFLESFPTININADNLPAVREMSRAGLAPLPPLPETAAVKERFIPGPEGASRPRECGVSG
ncbi:MAG: hypothetical protein ACK4MQ_11700 [Hyphomonas sp.]